LNNIVNVKNRNIFQSNDIMGVTYWLLNGEDEKYRLNINQTKILKIVMAMVNPKETLQEEYVFYDSEFMDIIGIENHTAQYIDIPEFLTDIMKNDTFKSIDSKGTFKIIHMFDYVEYNPKDKKIKLAFSNVMLKGLTNLEGNYTKYRLGNILNFKSLYSINLYELFKKELKGKQSKAITIDIDKLKEWLGLNDKYSRYYDFKNKVLDKVKEEINLFDDINFDYKEVRKGKKVIAIKFSIINKASYEIEVESASSEIAVASVEDPKDVDLRKQVHAVFRKHTITEIEARYILKDSDNNLDLIKQCYEYLLTKDKIDNVVGYMRKLVKGFNKPQFNNKVDSFNNHPQRNYDFAKFESVLLGEKNINDVNIYKE